MNRLSSVQLERQLGAVTLGQGSQRKGMADRGGGGGGGGPSAASWRESGKPVPSTSRCATVTTGAMPLLANSAAAASARPWWCSNVCTCARKPKEQISYLQVMYTFLTSEASEALLCQGNTSLNNLQLHPVHCSVRRHAQRCAVASMAYRQTQTAARKFLSLRARRSEAAICTVRR